MQFVVSARWPSGADVLSGPQAAQLLSEAQAIGATSSDGQEVVSLHLEAGDPVAAAHHAATALGAALGGSDTAHSTSDARHLLTSITAEQAGTAQIRAWSGDWTFPDLVSLAEIAAAAGVTRQRAQQWAKDRTDFPTPVLTTSLGPLYARAATDHWLATARRRAGRPRRDPS